MKQFLIVLDHKDGPTRLIDAKDKWEAVALLNYPQSIQNKIYSIKQVGVPEEELLECIPTVLSDDTAKLEAIYSKLTEEEVEFLEKYLAKPPIG